MKGPKDYINISVLQDMISGISLLLGLGTRMRDPCVYVAFSAPSTVLAVFWLAVRTLAFWVSIVFNTGAKPLSV